MLPSNVSARIRWMSSLVLTIRTQKSRILSAFKFHMITQIVLTTEYTRTIWTTEFSISISRCVSRIQHFIGDCPVISIIEICKKKKNTKYFYINSKMRGKWTFFFCFELFYDHLCFSFENIFILHSVLECIMRIFTI